MDYTERLASLFQKFPGIGKRQSERFVHFLVRQDKVYINELAVSIQALHGYMKRCTESNQYFLPTSDGQSKSPLALDPSRTRTVLMVVATDLDLLAIEKAHAYRGQYFVLGGLIPMIATNSHAHLSVTGLKKRIETGAQEDSLKEIILGFSLNPEGEHTRHHIIGELNELAAQYDLTITTLGRGLSTGTELEYSDIETIEYALGTRRPAKNT